MNSSAKSSDDADRAEAVRTVAGEATGLDAHPTPGIHVLTTKASAAPASLPRMVMGSDTLGKLSLNDLRQGAEDYQRPGRNGFRAGTTPFRAYQPVAATDGAVVQPARFSVA